jgi:mannose-6-phosphate isomerase-like protein (cupin superfamily)
MDKQHEILCKRNKKRESMTTNISSLVLNASEGEITFEASGEYWIWKATAETTNGRYDQAVTITLPQVGPLEHTHQQEELLYILEGTYRVKLGEHVFTASTGTSIRIPGGVSHAWRSLTTGKMLVIFLPGGLRGFFEGMRPLYLAPQLDMQALAALATRYGLVVTGPPLKE